MTEQLSVMFISFEFNIVFLGVMGGGSYAFFSKP